MRPTQGQTAVFEGQDAALSVLIAAKSVRREAHSEPYVGAAQACALFYRLPDHVDGRNGSFLRHLLDPTSHDAINDRAYQTLHHLYVCMSANERNASRTQLW
jgi:hypothetical protein